LQENDQDDYSFSSQSDDFDSSSEYQKLEESSHEIMETSLTQELDIEKVMNQSNLSKSMLHCLDGNDTSLISPSSSFDSRKRHLNDSPTKSSPESFKRPLIDSDPTDF
jgi:hypothetical protein